MKRTETKNRNLPGMKFITTFCFIIFLSSFMVVNSPAYAEAVTPYEAPRTIKNPMSPRNYTPSYTAPIGKFHKIAVKQGLFKKRFYHIYAPKNLDSYESRPALLLLLHGSQRNGAAMLDKWQTLADEGHFIILAPDGPGLEWTTSPIESTFLVKLMNKVQGEYGTDPKRRYVFGHSAGAIMTIVMIARHSDQFAAAALHAGQLAPNVLSSVIKKFRPGTPVTFITGTRDKGFPLEKVRMSAKTLWLAGADVKQFEIADHTHWYYDIAEYINTIAWYRMRDYNLP